MSITRREVEKVVVVTIEVRVTVRATIEDDTGTWCDANGDGEPPSSEVVHTETDWNEATVVADIEAGALSAFSCEDYE